MTEMKQKKGGSFLGYNMAAAYFRTHVSSYRLIDIHMNLFCGLKLVEKNKAMKTKNKKKKKKNGRKEEWWQQEAK